MIFKFHLSTVDSIPVARILDVNSKWNAGILNNDGPVVHSK